MTKIKVTNPIVELDGDEMTRIICAKMRRLNRTISDPETQYFDLSIQHRDETNDEVILDAAKAIKKYNVGIKCATITPDEDRVEEFSLKKMWKSPNGTIRNHLGGTVFRAPIICKNIPKLVTNWKDPIVVGRLAHADQYKCQDISINEPGILKLVYEAKSGERMIAYPGI